MAKKRKGRIRQTRTSFQKVFDSNPEIIQSFSWISRLPEFIHISITLIKNDYEAVEKDFFEISEFINSKFHFKQKFHFNLTHTLQLIIQDKTVLDKINSTVFKESFESLLFLIMKGFFKFSKDNLLKFLTENDVFGTNCNNFFSADFGVISISFNKLELLVFFIFENIFSSESLFSNKNIKINFIF